MTDTRSADGMTTRRLTDPLATDPDLYHLVFENDRVRVLEYRDQPGDATHMHTHPDSVMIPLANFRRRLTTDGREAHVELQPFTARWLDAQSHRGENVGSTPSHAIFVELKDPHGARDVSDDALGPSA